MSANLAIQITDGAFSSLSNEASSIGKTPAELASSVVENLFSKGKNNWGDASTARARFEECFGSLDLGRPIGIANESIDADLAREIGLR